MPRINAKNRVTGEEVSFDWDGAQPPTAKDVTRIADEQRASRITAKQKIADITKPSFTERLLTSDPVGIGLGVADRLGLNQPWHPIDAATEAVGGLKQALTGEVPPGTTPPANPRTAGVNRALKGTMGAVGPPLTAAAYALNPIGTAGAMMVGNTVADESRRAMEPHFSPEVSELTSGVAGLAAGGAAGAAYPRSMPNALAPEAPQVGGPPAVIPPFRPQPARPGFNASIMDMGPRQIPGQIDPFAPSKPNGLPSGPAPTVVPPNAPRQIAPPSGIQMPEAGSFATEQRVAALAPEPVNPLSPAEVPTVQTPEVRSQPEQSIFPESPAPPVEAPPAPIQAPPIQTPPIQAPQDIARAAMQRSVQPPPAPVPPEPQALTPEPQALTPEVLPPEPSPQQIQPQPTDIVRLGLDKARPVRPPLIPEVKAPTPIIPQTPQPIEVKSPEKIRSEPLVSSSVQVPDPAKKTPQIAPNGPESAVPNGQPAPNKLSPEISDDKVIQNIDKERQVGNESNLKLEGGTKKQKSLASEIKNVTARIDELELKDDNGKLTSDESRELQTVYRRLAKLEKDRDYSLKPDVDKYGPRVANMRSVHAEGKLAGLTHEDMSERAKEEYGVDSMSLMNHEQLAEFEQTLKTERMEREAEIGDLEGDEFEGKLTPEKKKRLSDLMKDTEGALNVQRGLSSLRDFFTTKGPEKGVLRKGWAQSGETTLQKEGGEGLARGMREMRTEAEKGAGGLTADYQNNTKPLTDPEFKEFLGIIQGTGRSTNPKVLNAARIENARLKQVERDLRGRTINIDPVTSTRTDRALLPEYYDQASRKIEEFNRFGDRKGNLPEDVHLEIQAIKRAGGDHRAAALIADSFFNPNRLSETQQKIWDKLSGIEVATKLGQAVLSNLTQPVNVALVTGNKTFLKSIAKRITDPDALHDLALRSGSTLSSVTHETQLTSGVKPHTFSSKMLEYTGFSPVEVNNRMVASMAGAEHAVQMFKKLKANPNDQYARRHLTEWLGLDPNALASQQKLTMDQILTAAHTLSDRTQFRTSALEIPPSWRSSVEARLVTLFKSFAFNQAKFMKDAVYNEMKAGNMRSLIPLLTTFPIIGYLMDRVKRGLGGRKQAETWLDGIISAYTTVGGMGIISDMAARTAVGKLSEYVAGPIIADTTSYLESLYKGVSGKDIRGRNLKEPWKDLRRKATRDIPVVGKTIDNLAR